MASLARDMNNVPMQGMGQYSSNAALQHEAMLKALPLLKKAAHQATLSKKTPDDKPVTVIEYGSAHGNNSYASQPHHVPYRALTEQKHPAVGTSVAVNDWLDSAASAL